MEKSLSRFSRIFHGVENVEAGPGGGGEGVNHRGPQRGTEVHHRGKTVIVSVNYGITLTAQQRLGRDAVPYPHMTFASGRANRPV